MAGLGRAIGVTVLLGGVACGRGDHGPTPSGATVGGGAEVRRYRVVELSAPPGTTCGSRGAISPNGRFVLEYCDPDRPFLWDGSEQREIAIPMATSMAVNDAGVVVGEFLLDARGTTRGFRWQDGAWIALPTLGSGQLSSAVAVSAAGTIVGRATVSEDAWHAAAWSAAGDVRDLAPGTTISEAFGISANETIVGRDYVYGPDYSDAVRFSEGGCTGLGTAHGAQAYGVNSSGKAVGSAMIGAGGAEHAVVFEGGTVQDLGTVEGFTASRLFAINESGVAVGEAYGGGTWPYSTIAVIDAGEGLVDLNSLVRDPDWLIVDARGIADDGTIAAVGVRLSSMKVDAAIVLRPVQEGPAQP